jgi:hypothetical protein
MTHYPSPWEPLADPDTGQLARPASIDRLIIPTAVEIVGDEAFSFQWTNLATGKLNIRQTNASGRLLERFVSARTDASLLQIARQYGPLGIIGTAVEWNVDPQEAAPHAGGHGEPIKAWHYFRDVFAALLTLSTALRGDASFDRQTFARLDWKGILLLTGDGLLKNFERWSPKQSRRIAVHTLTVWISRLVGDCGLRPGLRFGEHGKHVELVFGDDLSDCSRYGISLFGTLTLQLITALTGSGVASCSGCGRPYVPTKRRPAINRRRYCSFCRAAQIPQRDAKRDHRARERSRTRRQTTKK